MEFNIHKIAADLHDDADQYDAEHPDNPRKARSQHLSQIGDPCVRYLALDRLAGDKKTPFRAETLRLFARGRACEAWGKAFLLERWPNRVVALEQNVDDKGGLSGRIDVGWRIDDNPRSPIIPMEIKSTKQFDRMHSTDDLRGNKWTKKWIWQNNGYASAMKVAGALFFLVEPGDFKFRFVPMEFDPELAQQAIDKGKEVERCLDAVRKVTDGEPILTDATAQFLPDQIDDPYQCEDCRLKHVCNPALNYEATLKFVENSELEVDIIRMLELKPYKSEHEKLNDKKIKPTLKLLWEQNPTLQVLKIGKVAVTRKLSDVKPEKEPRKGFSKTVYKYEVQD